jgi:hypothetical protein
MRIGIWKEKILWDPEYYRRVRNIPLFPNVLFGDGKIRISTNNYGSGAQKLLYPTDPDPHTAVKAVILGGTWIISPPLPVPLLPYSFFFFFVMQI